MLNHVKYQLKKRLPVEGDEPLAQNPDARKFVTLSLKRSGQHAVINWICSQIQDTVHFNHCYFERRQLRNWITPVNSRVIWYRKNEKIDSGIQSRESMREFLSEVSRYSNVLYSFEDVDIENPLLGNYISRKSPTIVLILRDPYNWLASTMKRRDTQPQMLFEKKRMLVHYLEQALGIRDFLHHPVVAINYNAWTCGGEYRERLCTALGIPFSIAADQSVQEVPDFGGGSSFDGTAPIDGKPKTDFFERWKEFASDPMYLDILNDDYLVELSEKFFGLKKPF